MARIDNLTNFLTDIADAIRTKTGSQETISASSFDTEIINLPIPKDFNIIAPNSVSVDAFDETTLHDIQLFTFPKDKGISIFGTYYGKYNSEDNWYKDNGIQGNINIIEGTLTNAVELWINGYDAPYGKVQIAIVAEGYNTQIIEIPINKIVHDYGVIHIEISDMSYSDVINDLTWTVTNSETGEEVTPIYIRHLANYVSPTFYMALPEGNYNVTMHYGQDISVTQEYQYVTNNQITWCYLYPPALPGFVFEAMPSMSDDSGVGYGLPWYTASIQVYGEADTLLHTETFSLSNEQLRYSYRQSFSYYVVTINCWESGTNWTQTYYDSMSWPEINFIVDNNFGQIAPYLNNNVYTGNANTFIQDFSISLQEIEDGEVVKSLVENEDYFTYKYGSNIDSPVYLRIKYKSGRSVLISSSSTQYDIPNLTCNDGIKSMEWNLFIENHKPVITTKINLQDIDGNPLPYADKSSYSFQVLGSRNNTYTIEDDGEGNAQLIMETKLGLQNLSFRPGTSLAQLWYLVITQEDVAEYVEDTTLTFTMRLPVIIDPNYYVILMKASTIEGIKLSHIVNVVYPDFKQNEDTSIIYNWTECQPLDTNTTQVYWMAKVANKKQVLFEENVFTFNDVEYRAPRHVEYAGSDNKYSTKFIILNNVIINNTALLKHPFFWPYKGASASASYPGLYKIETYRNNELVDTFVFDNRQWYDCPMSFMLNDNVEFRIYKNQGTIQLPQWSTKYKPYNYTVVEEDLNKEVQMLNIYIDEIDAYINGDTNEDNNI